MPFTSCARSTQVEIREVATELPAELGAGEGELDGRLEPAHRRARVVADALEGIGVDVLLDHEGLDRVGELDLATGSARRLLELLEDLRCQDVAADDGEV